jgi:hypothetical protein
VGTTWQSPPGSEKGEGGEGARWAGLGERKGKRAWRWRFGPRKGKRKKNRELGRGEKKRESLGWAKKGEEVKRKVSHFLKLDSNKFKSNLNSKEFKLKLNNRQIKDAKQHGCSQPISPYIYFKAK